MRNENGAIVDYKSGYNPDNAYIAFDMRIGNESYGYVSFSSGAISQGLKVRET